jgi:hypothetical protein
LPDIAVFKKRCSECGEGFRHSRKLRTHLFYQHRGHKKNIIVPAAQSGQKRELPSGKKMPSEQPVKEVPDDNNTTIQFTAKPQWDEELGTPPYLHAVDEDTLLNGSFDWDEPFRGMPDTEPQETNTRTPELSRIAQATECAHPSGDPVPPAETDPVEATHMATPERSSEDILQAVRKEIDVTMTNVESATVAHPTHYVQRERAQLPDGTIFERETISFYDPRPPKTFRSASSQTYEQFKMNSSDM